MSHSHTAMISQLVIRRQVKETFEMLHINQTVFSSHAEEFIIIFFVSVRFVCLRKIHSFLPSKLDCITDMAVNHWLYISVILSATFIYCWVCGWACGCWLMFSANVRGRTIKFLTPKLVGPTTNRVGFGIKAIVKCFRNLSPIKYEKKQWEKNRKEEKKLRWIWLSSLPKTRKHEF